MVSALLALLMTTCSDPGIVPRERGEGNLPYKMTGANPNSVGEDLEQALHSEDDQFTPGKFN